MEPAGAIAAQAQRLKRVDSRPLGGQVAVQQHTRRAGGGRLLVGRGQVAFRFDQHRVGVVALVVAQPVVVEAQCGAQEPEPRRVERRHRCDTQPRARRNALNFLGRRKHRRQRQPREAPQQRGFVQGKSGLRNRRHFEQKRQMLGRYTRHFDRSAKPGIGIQVQRRRVGKPLRLAAGINQARPQGPKRLRDRRRCNFVPFPDQRPGRPQAD